jgi:soluble lytic murein transglycosylase-like protein
MGLAVVRAVGVALSAWSTCASANAQSEANLDACFHLQAARFGLDPQLLRSIASVESGMRAHAENRTHLSRTGTRDIGLMQINSGWLPTLARYGIDQADLHEPCTNIEVGAWILRGLVSRLGDSWDAVGAYNAACTELKGVDCQRARARYAWKVWRRQQQSREEMGGNVLPSKAQLGPAIAARAAVPAGLVSAARLQAIKAPRPELEPANDGGNDATEIRQP